MNNANARYFRTNNFYLSTFLFAKGFELANIDFISEKRATFVFVESAERQKMTHAFNFASQDDELVRVDARKLIQAIKGLKDKLYQKEY